ncbi:hypothetical protein [Chlorobium ferrooxidans]|uniref:hypothetical protein n=1 Tax=Chlorobium ferrooxidans TaxID=84205 RepID=UPI0012EA8288|nr:hypothetical protein [Chlorobium ferrooxidans]
MEHKEIKKGVNVSKGYCGGDAKFSCTKVFPSDACAKPSNLSSCSSAENLKTKGDIPGKACCGGGTLQAATVGTSCGGSTSLCNNTGETLK